MGLHMDGTFVLECGTIKRWELGDIVKMMELVAPVMTGKPLEEERWILWGDGHAGFPLGSTVQTVDFVQRLVWTGPDMVLHSKVTFESTDLYGGPLLAGSVTAFIDGSEDLEPARLQYISPLSYELTKSGC